MKLTKRFLMESSDQVFTSQDIFKDKDWIANATVDGGINYRLSPEEVVWLNTMKNKYLKGDKHPTKDRYEIIDYLIGNQIEGENGSIVVALDMWQIGVALREDGDFPNAPGLDENSALQTIFSHIAL